LYKAQVGPVALAPRQLVLDLIAEASAAVTGHKFGRAFLVAEWDQVVDAWQLDSWDAYRDVPRLGRKTRLSEAQRKALWDIFERARAGLNAKKALTQAGLFGALAGALKGKKARPFDYAVVDEAQDVGVSQLKFFAALGGDRANALFFAGDLGQRIFQQPFSWKAAGVDLRGRSRTLRVNYRTSHQIRERADKLLGPEVGDADDGKQDRSDTVSVFNGTPPEVRVLDTEAKETKAVADWLKGLAKAGVLPHEIGVFVRSAAQVPRATAAVKQAGLTAKVLDANVDVVSGSASVGTMHLAKGLEFRAVAVLACDDEVIPLQERIESAGDEADLKEVYDTERHLLYVACTRARDHLLVTATKPPSEFLADLGH
jgi:superfamily I DNA/RNA helicase